MSVPRYPAYKDSGVEWLGEIPAHWEVCRLRFTAKLNPSKAELTTYGPETVVSFLPMEAVGEDGRLDLGLTRLLADVLNGYTYIGEGDIGFAKITPCFENGKGAIFRGLQNGIAFGTTELTIARVHDDIATTEFIFQIISSSLFRKLGEASMYGAGGQKRVPDDFFRDFKVALPPVSEQTVITSFLGRETAKIDALIAEQEHLIALLKEKRQAVISHAVTKGLNPDVPMKESGVEWLGQVPKHWDLARVKHGVRSMGQGWSPQCDGFPAEDEEWGVLKVGCVNGGIFTPSENKKLPDDLEPIPELTLQTGDILISRANTRELVGSAAFIDVDYERLMLCDKLYRLRVKLDRWAPEFLALYLSSDNARRQIEISATGASSSMVNIGQSTILEMPIALPPKGEQIEIVGHVDALRREIDNLMAQATSGITLLQERRAALISAAVTGKIDVRGLALAPGEAA